MIIKRAKLTIATVAVSFLLFFQCVSAGFAASKVGSYDQLIAAIREARQASQTRIEQSKVREAWETGKLINEHILCHKERAEYGAHVVERLAKDLGTSRTELKYMLEFAQAYPISPTSGQLTWSDYRELLSLNDAKQREEVSRKAASENWDAKQIRSEVKRINQKNRTGIEPVKRLIATPGKPGTYKVILAKEGPYAGELALDLGFSNYVRLAEAVENASHFKEGDVVQLASHFPKGGSRGISSATMRRLDAASGAQISPNPSLQKRGTEADLFTYEAYVYDVLDGDTVNAVVDLGFGFVTTQTLRLRGIDAPEIKTSDGIEAKKALEKMLGVSFPRKRESSSGSPIKTFGDDNKENPILIKTVKSDKYDRYLADVFVGDTYINQKLVEQGLAVIVDG